MSQDKGNDMRLEDSSQDEGTVTSPSSTIEDKLKDLFEQDESWRSEDSRYYDPAILIPKLQAIITTETTNKGCKCIMCEFHRSAETIEEQA